MFIHLKFLKNKQTKQPPDFCTFQGRNWKLWWGSPSPLQPRSPFRGTSFLALPFSAHFLFMCHLARAISPPEMFWFIMWNKQDPQRQQRFSAYVFLGSFFLLRLLGYIPILSHGCVTCPLNADWECQFKILLFKLSERFTKLSLERMHLEPPAK